MVSVLIVQIGVKMPNTLSQTTSTNYTKYAILHSDISYMIFVISFTPAKYHLWFNLCSRSNFLEDQNFALIFQQWWQGWGASPAQDSFPLPPPYPPVALRARYPAIPVSYTRLTIPTNAPSPQPFPYSDSREHTQALCQSQPSHFVFCLMILRLPCQTNTYLTWRGG